MPKDMKSGKGSRSSKTARVLSLLTDSEAEAPESAGEQAGPETPKLTPQQQSDAATQAQIRDALESELLSELPKASAAPEPVPTEAAPVQPAAPEPVPAKAPVQPAIPEPVPAKAAPAPVSPPVAGPEEVHAARPSEQEEDDEDYTCLNVTQALVEEKADKYIKMFGMCDCKRCRIDVIAMALSNLPAKYVVVNNKDINPRLSYYESKYNAAVITQVMGACKRVLERPHHKR